MAAGKTTLGGLAAQRLGVEFIDLDLYIEQRYHATVSDLFAAHGEEGFRQIEQRMLHEVGEFENVLVATGGGTPCFFDNMDYMNRQGLTVHLNASIEVLVQRLGENRAKRPILAHKTDEELRTFIEQALRLRTPYYEQARHTLQADRLENERDIRTSLTVLLRLLRPEPVSSRPPLSPWEP
jgi:shikimate kinase